MGEAKRRKLAGTYPTKTPADAVLNISPARIDPDVEAFLAGHDRTLTEDQRDLAARLMGTPTFYLVEAVGLAKAKEE